MRCNGGGAWSTARGIVTRVPVSSPSSRIGIQMCAHHIFQGFRLGLPISCPELDREALVRGRDPLHEQFIDSVILDRTVKVQIKKLEPLSDTCTLFSRLPVCTSVSDNALAFYACALKGDWNILCLGACVCVARGCWRLSVCVARGCWHLSVCVAEGRCVCVRCAVPKGVGA